MKLYRGVTLLYRGSIYKRTRSLATRYVHLRDPTAETSHNAGTSYRQSSPSGEQQAVRQRSTTGKKLTNPHWGKISEFTKADVGLVRGSASCLSVET